MLISLAGPDIYRRQQYLKKLTAEFEKKHPAGVVEKFYLDEKEARENLAEFARNQGLFSTKKLGVVWNIDTIKSDKEFKAFFKTIEDVKETTLVLLFDKKPTKEFATMIKNVSLTKDFPALKGAEIPAFITSEAKTLGATLSQEDVFALANEFGSDTWSIVTELEKMALGSQLARSVSTPEFFPLVQRIKGNFPVSSRLSALSYLLEQEDAAAVFNIAASLTSGKEKNKMADYDVAIKSGKLEYSEALLDFVLQ